MSWPNNVLIYLDALSDVPQDALERGLAIAGRSGARVSVVDIVEPPPRPIWSKEEEIEAAHQGIRWAKEAQLEQAVTTAGETCSDVSGELLDGKIFIELIRKVIRGEHDLLVKTMMRESDALQRLFGTTATHLLRKCPCPVLLVKPEQEGFRHVVAAIGPVESEESSAFNKRILESAAAVTGEGGTLTIIHAWEFYGESMLGKRMSVDEVDRKVEEERQRIEEELSKQILAVLPDLPAENIVIENGPAHAIIPSYLKRVDADLIVLGTIARSGLRGLLIGNTAEAVMEQVDCSILALKPEGFVSPIELE